jgi:hypothetical protein
MAKLIFLGTPKEHSFQEKIAVVIRAMFVHHQTLSNLLSGEGSVPWIMRSLFL